MDILLNPSKDKKIVSIRGRLALNLEHDFRLLKLDVQNEAVWRTLHAHLLDGITGIAVNAYYDGRKDLGEPSRAGDAMLLRRWAQARADFVSKEVKDWTYQNLGIQAAIKKNKLLGKDRSRLIVSDNVWNAFFTGKRKSWTGILDLYKSWLVSSAHDRDDICDDNEDAGKLHIEETFPSGDQVPPAHMSCECTLFLTRR